MLDSRLKVGKVITNLFGYFLEKGCFEKKLTNLRLLGECRKRNPETFRRNASIPVKGKASAFFLPKKLRNDGYIIHFLMLRFRVETVVGKSDLPYILFSFFASSFLDITQKAMLKCTKVQKLQNWAKCRQHQQAGNSRRMGGIHTWAPMNYSAQIEIIICSFFHAFKFSQDSCV